MAIKVTSDRLMRKIYSDASCADPERHRYSVDDIFACIKSNTRWAPKALVLSVRGEFVGTEQEDWVTILLVPTCVRAVYDRHNPIEEYHEPPEYEFEGWLMGDRSDYPEQIWVVGSMLWDQSIALCRLESGEETPTAPSSLLTFEGVFEA